LPSSAEKFEPATSRTSHSSAVLAAIAVLALLPGEAGRANWLSDAFKGSPKHEKSPGPATSSKHAASAKASANKTSASKASSKHAGSPDPHHVKLAALGPANLPASAFKLATCEPKKFRIVLDVGHTAESEGAISARNVPEFAFNLRLAQQIAQKLKAEGFVGTKLLVTEGKAKPSLFKRVAAANDLNADIFLSVHHDSVPDKLLQDWDFDGKKSHYSDRFSGYSVFVSHENPAFKTSLAFAELVAKEMKASGLQYAPQYTMPIMGHYQHPLLDKETGVYAYDELVVLRKTRMPAVLLEAGSIINRDEELRMDSPERRDTVTGAVVAAVKDFCGPQEPFLGPP
jgi:N-acetylmuramoyl-L-alanine amidase